MSALGWASLGLSALQLPFALYQDYSQSKKMAKQHQYNIDMLNRTTAAQKDLFDYQFDANNQYNSPAAQMERLQLAGLNPNLMYGNGASTGNASSSMPGVNATSNVGLPNTPDFAGAVSSISSTLNQARALDLQQKSIENETKRSDSSSALDWAKVRQQALETLAYANKDTPEYISALKNVELADSQIKKNEAETSNIEKEGDILDIKKEITEYEKMNTKLLGDRLAQEIKEIQQNIAESKSRVTLNHSLASYYRVLSQLTEEQIPYVKAQTFSITLNNILDRYTIPQKVKAQLLGNCQMELMNKHLRFENEKQFQTWFMGQVKLATSSLGDVAGAYKDIVGTNSQVLFNTLKFAK